MVALILDEFWVAAKSKQGETEMSSLQEYLDSCRLKHTTKREGNRNG